MKMLDKIKISVWVFLFFMPMLFPSLIHADILNDFSTALKTREGTEPTVVPEVHDFSGKLIKSGPIFNAGKNDVSGITNFRWYRSGTIGTRQGMTAYTSNAVPSNYDITHIFPLTFENAPQIWAITEDTSGVSAWDITNGSFSTVSEYQTSGVSTTAKITACNVRDTFVMADSSQITVYSGDSAYPTALLQLHAGSTTYVDRYDWIFDGDQHSVPSGDTLFVGYSRPFDAFQADKDDGTFDGPASSVTEYFYDGKMRFWSTCQVSSGASTVQLPKIQTSPRELGTDWDGLSWEYARSFQVQTSSDSAAEDYSLFVQDESEETYADISKWDSGGTITAGFIYKPRLVHIYLPEDFKNGAASSVSGYYWNGSQLVVVPSWNDGTSHNGAALAQIGILDFDKITDWEPRKIGQSPIPYYTLYLKNSVSSGISDYVRIFKVSAIPDYDSPSSVGNYKMAMTADNRLWLANGRDLQRVLVSAAGQPDCFIGSDSQDEDNPLIIGKREKMIWMGQVGKDKYFMKKTENWGLTGVNPSTWDGGLYRIDGKPPCVATDSVIPIQMGNTVSILYVAASGIYDLLGNGIPISLDISDYFEPGNSKAISASDLANFIGWFDPINYEVHFLISRTGLELVYNMLVQKWSTFDRNSAVALNCGTFFKDNNNNRYHFGGAADGKVYYLEQGQTDGGYTIYSGYERPPMILSSGGVDGRSNLLRMAIRYEIPGGETTLSGNSFYITNSISDNATERQGSFDLNEDTDNGFKVLSFNGLDAARKGYNFKFRFRFPGRINIQAELLQSIKDNTALWQ